MRRNLLLLMVALAVSGAAFGQNSGCAQYFNSNDIVCGTGGDCTFNTPGGNGLYGVGFTCTSFTCCGSSQQTCFWDFVNCYWAKLEDPKVRQQLAGLSEHQDLLVASCGGNYRPLDQVLLEGPKLPDLRLRRSTLISSAHDHE